MSRLIKSSSGHKDILYSSGEPRFSWLLTNLKAFERKDGVPASNEDVSWAYFLWLIKQVGLNGPDPEQECCKKENNESTYFTLATILFRTEYKPRVDRDKNRIEDAKLLREDFALYCTRYKNYEIIATPGASFLEVMIALCQRFDTEVMMDENHIDRSKDWFWMMLKNADLDIYSDSGFTEIDEEASPFLVVDSILKVINERTYREDGKGGFFPLKNPQNDQRKVELWKQMHAYFLENLIN